MGKRIPFNFLSFPGSSSCVRSFFATSRDLTFALVVNMAGRAEAKFDAAVNVVRSMPKKGITSLLEKDLK